MKTKFLMNAQHYKETIIHELFDTVALNNIKTFDEIVGIVDHSDQNDFTYDVVKSRELAKKIVDPLRNFEALRSIVENHQFSGGIFITEGPIILKGLYKPVIHTWLSNFQSQKIIDPVMEHLGYSKGNIQYYAGYTVSCDEYLGYNLANLEENQPIYNVVDNVLNEARIRMNDAFSLSVLGVLRMFDDNYIGHDIFNQLIGVFESLDYKHDIITLSEVFKQIS